MKYRIALLCLFIAPTVFAADIKIEIEGLSGDVEKNANAMVSAIPITSDTISLRLKRLVTEAIKVALRAKGYYDAEVSFDESTTLLTNMPVLVVKVNAGEPVLIESTDVTIAGDAAYDREYIVLVQQNLPNKGDILDHGKYDGFRSNIASLSLRKGYFDAETFVHQLAVAPQFHKGFWNIAYGSGQRYRLGKTTFLGSQIRQDFLQNLLPYHDGSFYGAEHLSELNRRLSSTNWFKSVVVSPSFDKQTNGKTLPIEVVLSPRSKNIVELGGGFSTDVGPRVKANWLKPWVNASGHSIDTGISLSKPEQQINFSYKLPLKKNPLEHYYTLEAGYKRENQNDTKSDSTVVSATRHWDFSKSWQRAIGVQMSREDYTQGEITDTAYLLYPSVSISRTRQRGGLMPVWGDSQRYSIDVSHTTWGSDINFAIFQAQNIWIRTYASKHRFVGRVSVGWMETRNFNRIPSSLRFFGGGDRSIRGYKYKSISPTDSIGKLTGAAKMATASLEYQYNIHNKWWGAAFYDAGEAVNDFSRSALKSGAGIGIRWMSPIGPVKFDLAQPVGRKDENKKNDLQFYLGIGPEL